MLVKLVRKMEGRGKICRFIEVWYSIVREVFGIVWSYGLVEV